jgi:hypothetical protein
MLAVAWAPNLANCVWTGSGRQFSARVRHSDAEVPWLHGHLLRQRRDVRVVAGGCSNVPHWPAGKENVGMGREVCGADWHLFCL